MSETEALPRPGKDSSQAPLSNPLTSPNAVNHNWSLLVSLRITTRFFQTSSTFVGSTGSFLMGMVGDVEAGSALISVVAEVIATVATRRRISEFDSSDI